MVAANFAPTNRGLLSMLHSRSYSLAPKRLSSSVTHSATTMSMRRFVAGLHSPARDESSTSTPIRLNIPRSGATSATCATHSIQTTLQKKEWQGFLRVLADLVSTSSRREQSTAFPGFLPSERPKATVNEDERLGLTSFCSCFIVRGRK